MSDVTKRWKEEAREQGWSPADVWGNKYRSCFLCPLCVADDSPAAHELAAAELQEGVTPSADLGTWIAQGRLPFLFTARPVSAPPLLKPNVVFFTEFPSASTGHDSVIAAFCRKPKGTTEPAASRVPRLCLVVGTSHMISYAARWLSAARARGMLVIHINPDPAYDTPADDEAGYGYGARARSVVHKRDVWLRTTATDGIVCVTHALAEAQQLTEADNPATFVEARLREAARAARA